MRTHIQSQCLKYPYREDKNKREKKKKKKKTQSTLAFKPKEEEVNSGKLVPWVFNFEECKKALAEMIILDELSFRFMEGFGFRNFMFVTQPRFNPIPCRTTRAVHGSGQVRFGPDPDSTRLNRVTKIATRNRPDIWGRPGGSGHQLIGSDWSVWRVWAWASIWAEFVILHKFFF